MANDELFADNMLVYLNKGDKIKDLEKIIKEFCMTSMAKFNLERLEVLPIGSMQYREALADTRQMGREDNVVPAYIRLIKDGELMRMLGSWVGNNISIENK